MASSKNESPEGRKLRRLKSILTDKNVVVDTSEFINGLCEEDLIGTREAQELERKRNYVQIINGTFTIILRQNPLQTYNKVKNVLEKMERGDIVKRLEGEYQETIVQPFSR